MKIWHVQHSTFGKHVWGEAKPPVFPSQYQLVAEIEATDIDQAWERTQNITDAWTTHDYVLFRREPQIRSTSVDDVIEVDGTYHRVEAIGFKELRNIHLPFISVANYFIK